MQGISRVFRGRGCFLEPVAGHKRFNIAKCDFPFQVIGDFFPHCAFSTGQEIEGKRGRSKRLIALIM